MSIENEIAGLTQSTTDLLEAVNTKKAVLDTAVATAEAAAEVATAADAAQLGNNNGASLVGTSSGANVQESLDALASGQISGVIVFTTYALLDAYTPADTTEQKASFKVTNDSDSSLNGYYSWVSGTAYTKDADLVVNTIDAANTSDAVSGAAVTVSQMTDYTTYPCFARYNSSDLSTLTNTAAQGITRGQIYKAFKSLELYDVVDTTIPLKLHAVWNDAYNPDHHYFRLIISKLEGGAWVYVFDSGNIEMADLNIENDQVLTYTLTSNYGTLVAEIDMSMLPVNSSFVLNPNEPEMIISSNCFKKDIINTVSSSPINLKQLETPVMSFENEYLSNVWVRYKADLSGLETDYKAGYKRKLKYQAFKRLELYGFDASQPLKLSYFWVNSYQPEQNLYRLIFDSWDGSQWVRVFDVNGQKNDLGIVDGQVFTWDAVDGERRIIADIDFTNLADDDNSTLELSEPAFIVGQQCYKDREEMIEERLATFNANKSIVNSRRKPTFVFIWDDLNPSDALVWDVSQEFGFIPSFALQTNKLTDATALFYQGLYLKGATMLSHSVSHPVMSASDSLTLLEAEAQMKDSKNAIESYGMQVSGWVTPNSSLHTTYLDLMEQYYGYGFTGLNAGWYNESVDPIKMGRFGLESAMLNHNIAAVKARIDTAIQYKELLVFYSHKLPSTYTNDDGTSRLTEAEFREILTYLKEKSDANECQVLSCDEAVKQYYKTPVIA